MVRFLVCLLLLLQLNNVSAVEDEHDRALTLLAGLKSLSALSADFSQKVKDENQQTISASSGTLMLKRPGQFRWDYTQPFEQLILADGQQIWVYDIELDQASVRPQQDTLDATPALLLSGSVDIEQHFSIENTVLEKDTEWVTLKPLKTEGSFTRVRIGFKAGFLQKMQMQDHFGQQTLFVFSKVLPNPELAPDLFVFTPPEGVDVLGQ
jgi:outer membrane lipoprotein carrier protein